MGQLLTWAYGAEHHGEHAVYLSECSLLDSVCVTEAFQRGASHFNGNSKIICTQIKLDQK